MKQKYPKTLYQCEHSNNQLKVFPACVFGMINFQIKDYDNTNMVRLSEDEVKSLIKNLKIMLKNYR